MDDKTEFLKYYRLIREAWTLTQEIVKDPKKRKDLNVLYSLKEKIDYANSFYQQSLFLKRDLSATNDTLSNIKKYLDRLIEFSVTPKNLDYLSKIRQN